MGNHRAERAPKRRTSATASPTTGKRRATPPARRSVVKLPSLPLVAGVAVLAVSAGGAVTASGAGAAVVRSEAEGDARSHRITVGEHTRTAGGGEEAGGGDAPSAS